MNMLLPRVAESVRVLREAPFFRELDDDQRDAVLELSRVEDWEAGQYVYRLGEPARDFYVLLSGVVRLTIGLDKRLVSSGDILRRGQVFGWAALTPNANTRIATASCVTPASLLAIDGRQMVALMDRDHTLGYKVMRELVLLVTGTLTACTAG